MCWQSSLSYTVLVCTNRIAGKIIFISSLFLDKKYHLNARITTKRLKWFHNHYSERYIIHEIKGFKRFSKHEECLNARNDLSSELKNLFNPNDYKINSYEKKTFEDKDSIYRSIDFYFDKGLVRLYCVDWSAKIRDDRGGFYDDSLTVVIYDSEFQSFLLEMSK